MNKIHQIDTFLFKNNLYGKNGGHVENGEAESPGLPNRNSELPFWPQYLPQPPAYLVLTRQVHVSLACPSFQCACGSCTDAPCLNLDNYTCTFVDGSTLADMAVW